MSLLNCHPARSRQSPSPPSTWGWPCRRWTWSSASPCPGSACSRGRCSGRRPWPSGRGPAGLSFSAVVSFTAMMYRVIHTIRQNFCLRRLPSEIFADVLNGSSHSEMSQQHWIESLHHDHVHHRRPAEVLEATLPPARLLVPQNLEMRKTRWKMPVQCHT